MNTIINNSKGMYIARPKNNTTEFTTEDRVYANKLRGKPYVAYPKSTAPKNSTDFAPVKMSGGLFVAYPQKQAETAEAPAAVNKLGRIYLSDNYMAPPDFNYHLTLPVFRFNRRKRKKSSRSWNFNLFQLFRLRVS